VETQCLADSHGKVVVVSTRDCSLQRRHQKLVEEAPAPFLTDEQETVLRESSKAIMREAGYIGAGTCEFLIGQDGAVSFLEVNTRLQVEHPVTEEVSGIDLVLEMFRIADGQALGFGDPDLRGHSIEFRINAEDPGRGFLPAPGRLTAWNPPAGPGIRVDAGYVAGMTVPPMYDSLIAKLIVTGADRPQALARARRALAEFEAEGMPTVLPFHRAVLADPAFTSAPFAVHTAWIETEFAAHLPPYAGDGSLSAGAGGQEAERERIVVEVGGKRIEVSIPAGLGVQAPRPAGTQPVAPADGRVGRRPAERRGSRPHGAADGDVLASPMQGTIVKIVATQGEQVTAGQTIVVLEAMKMEQPLSAHKDGTVRELSVAVGQTVSAGQAICRISD
jgi:acetyl-CoA/propionyl-CoA carboxylase, biotin carboxylase, biotin carboxyl carrier protein